ncbi:hypothetical protein TcCL_ESM07589, partial [Trypanosoma cruzi]
MLPRRKNAVVVMHETDWTAITFRRRSCTLPTARWLPWVRTAVHVLRQCHLLCHLWPHGLPSTARESVPTGAGPLCSASFHADGLTRIRPTIAWAVGSHASSPTLCACSAMRLIDFSILVCTSPPLHSSSCPFAVDRGWAQELGRRSSTMRSFLVGCVHSALHHGIEATAPCPALTHLHSLEVRHRDSCTASLGPRASKKDTSAHLAANLAPLRRIVGFLEPTQHERLTFLWYIEEERGAICSETMPYSIHGNAVTSIPLPRDAVLDGMRRVCSHMGIFPHHTHAPHAEQRISS